ncbi:hypothetical protein SRB17_06280 [Streptomyces sp. RB17]|uniref:hypothetical protein n=1 Tax=Streptomyces sp. RB17 TaxID=2585197 RepID=UPI001306EE10|nr:hypothetical protein [Streptomyces sp. RB17]MQY32674.1 hypothetical protein [Streptomyces sp. RB17]
MTIPGSWLPLVRAGMWLAFTVGGLCAAAVAAVPLIGGVWGVPPRMLDQLGVFPWLLAASVLLIAVGQSATSVLVALGHSAQVMRSGMLGTAVSVTLSVLLVGEPGTLPSHGLTGAGVAILTSTLTRCAAARCSPAAASVPGDPIHARYCGSPEWGCRSPGRCW